MPTDSFSATGGWQSWNVPKDVTAVTVTVDGAGSSSNPAGRVTGRLVVNDQQVLKILVGEAGQGPSGPGSRTGGDITVGGGGRGGDGMGSTSDGGFSGGGGTFIRRNTTDGTLLCAAGGAGGDSGDNGQGGEGGAAVGQAGDPGPGSGAVGNATGGTQAQGGNGGTSSAGAALNGDNADNSIGARGGRGGSANSAGGGGGGGGGGYRAGGGGQAQSIGLAPGGGGGGGSNYTGALTGPTSEQGGGGLGDGHVTIAWVNPPPGNQPPSPPTNVKIDGKNEANGLATKSVGRVEVEAELNDPDKDRVRMLVRYSRSDSFSTYKQEWSDRIDSGDRVAVVLTDLDQDTLWHYRLYAEDVHDKLSLTYNSGTFWTNRRPNPPHLTAPSDNASISNLISVTFDWTPDDDDPNDDQSGFTLRWRTAATSTRDAGPFTVVEKTGVAQSSWQVNPGTFKSSTFYEWQVRTRDQQGRWGDYSDFRSFYIVGTTAPPIPLSPVKNVGVDATQQTTFKWRFIDPAPGESQSKADFRYRLAGESDNQWITVFGGTVVPGGDRTWTFARNTFSFPGYHYEWQVRAYNSSGVMASDWSDSAFFWTIGTPGSGIPQPPDTPPEIQGSLGCGTYRAFVYERGGKVLRGEITPLQTLTFKRVRDDISNCVLLTNGFDDDCGELLKTVRSWLHEIVIFRDGERVWEGPVTRITYNDDSVEFEAQDVMVYVYRRIMRQGFNDAYRVIDGEQFGLPTVVDRATQIIVNALAPSDPNILPYLTTFEFADDAQESRVVPDYSTTAWEQIDDMAANAGLDYTVVGRRIILWDTHRPIGRLPEMRNGDFSDSPIITEYGMQLCNYFGVTNNSGVWGAAVPKSQEHDFEFYGPIEMLASAYGESEGGGGNVLTPQARDRLEKALRQQARRNIAHRWPTPVVVRVPDNSTLNPDANVGFSQLIPGTWIPLRATSRLRDVVQWQKLDSVSVSFVKGQETVQVVMSPAPNNGEDPDASGGDVDGGDV